MLLVTSMGKAGYHQYGQKMLQTISGFSTLPLRVYTEDEITFPSPAETWRLQEVDGWARFQELHGHINPEAYLFNAPKFSHKVFAQLDAFQSEHKYVVWLDADITFKAELKASFLEKLVADHFVAYLGRKECHSECGFMVFNIEHPDFKTFVERYSRMYYESRLFFLDYWTDCHAFDHSIQGLQARNLTPDAQGICDVFSQSALKDIMDHDKGALKYKEDVA